MIEWGRSHKFTFITGLCSAIALALAIVFWLYPIPSGSDSDSNRTAKKQLRAEDFQIRFSVSSSKLTDDDIERAPAAIPLRATLGKLSLYFDLVRLDALEHPYSRGGSRPKLVYNAENIRLINVTQYPYLDDLLGGELRFGLPFKLYEFAGEETLFDVNLHIDGQWYTEGYKKYDGGIVYVKVNRVPKGE